MSRFVADKAGLYEMNFSQRMAALHGLKPRWYAGYDPDDRKRYIPGPLKPEVIDGIMAFDEFLKSRQMMIAWALRHHRQYGVDTKEISRAIHS